MKVCVNCGLEQDGNRFCSKCGDNLIELKKEQDVKPVEKKQDDMLDLNKDGKVNAKDVSIAAKVLRKAKKIKRRK